jgi:hypothetical protein
MQGHMWVHLHEHLCGGSAWCLTYHFLVNIYVPNISFPFDIVLLLSKPPCSVHAFIIRLGLG